MSSCGYKNFNTLEEYCLITEKYIKQNFLWGPLISSINITVKSRNTFKVFISVEETFKVIQKIFNCSFINT